MVLTGVQSDLQGPRPIFFQANFLEIATALIPTRAPDQELGEGASGPLLRSLSCCPVWVAPWLWGPGPPFRTFTSILCK